MEADYQRIRGTLEKQFQEALKRRNAASAYFEEVSRAIPSGLPNPDGTQRIINASAEYSVALKAVTRAVQRIADFQVHGIVPEELSEDGCEPSKIHPNPPRLERRVLR